MAFIGGMFIGLGIGVIIIFALSAVRLAKQADRDYERALNDPDNGRMDRQDGRYAGPASRPSPGL